MVYSPNYTLIISTTISIVLSEILKHHYYFVSEDTDPGRVRLCFKWRSIIVWLQLQLQYVAYMYNLYMYIRPTKGKRGRLESGKWDSCDIDQKQRVGLSQRPNQIIIQKRSLLLRTTAVQNSGVQRGVRRVRRPRASSRGASNEGVL